MKIRQQRSVIVPDLTLPSNDETGCAPSFGQIGFVGVPNSVQYGALFDHPRGHESGINARVRLRSHGLKAHGISREDNEFYFCV